MFVCAHLSQAAGRCVNTMNYGLSCSGGDLFYSSLSSRTPRGAGKTQNLPIFHAWEVSPGLYWLKLGKEKLESFHTFPVWKILLFKRIFQSEKQLSKAKLCFSLLEMNSFAVCQDIFFRFKGKRRQEMPRQGKGKTKAGTQHGLGMTQELSSCMAWSRICSLSGFLFSTSLEWLIFPLQGCFQASGIKILQGFIVWHRSPCSSGVWHCCLSKVMVRAGEKAVFHHALNSSSALHSPSKGRVAVNRRLLSSGFLCFEFMPIPTVIIQGIR